MLNSAKRKICGLLAAALCLGALAACGGTAEPSATADPAQDIEVNASLSGQKLTAGTAADNVFSLTVDFDAGLNPLTTDSTLNMVVNGLVYDTVFQVDDSYHVTSRILSDWYYVAESSVWVLTIKDGIAMHDGSTLTADDVAYSISRAIQYGSDQFYSKRLGTVYSGGSGNTVYIQSAYADTLLPARLTIPVIKSGTVLDEAPPGSGPYRYSAEHDKLERFDGYEGSETLPVDTIYLRQYTDAETLISDYESALVDLTVNDRTSIYDMGYGGKNEKRVFSTTHMHYIGFNGYSTFLCYPQYRYALNWIIDRAAIADEVLDGAAVATALPIHPNSALFDKTLNDSLAYDPGRCLTEFEKQGCRDLDGDGQLEFAISGGKVEIDIQFLVCSDTTSKVIAARRIAKDMQSIGLNVTLKELSWRDYKKALEDGEFDMYYAEVSLTPDWDILPLIEKLEDEDNVTNLNYGRWSLPDLEDALYTFLASDDDTRAQNTSLYLNELLSTSVILPVCFENREVISHLGVITGMSPNQYNIFDNIQNWTIQLG